MFARPASSKAEEPGIRIFKETKRPARRGGKTFELEPLALMGFYVLPPSAAIRLR
jgi:hypothetical protein